MGLGNYILLWTQLKFFCLSGYWPRHEIIILSQADNNRCGTKAKQIVYDKRRHLWCCGQACKGNILSHLDW
jgi:hypothetical protein